MWVTFTKNFDFNPAHYGGRVTFAYRAGDTKNVTRECAAAAKKAEAAHDSESRKPE